MESKLNFIPRKIIHIDMDAFYASIEQRDNVDLQGKPIAVGGFPEGRGGVVATASYEARKFGVKSAMSSKKAIQLCPTLIFVRPRFDIYKSVSNKIREIFYRYTDLVEPLSLDEAYLDVTTDKENIGSAIEIASRIRASIYSELQLTASAGVSINKFVAKIASDLNKPDGLTFIGPSKIEGFMESLAVEKFFGVGKVTAAKMRNMGIHSGADLKKLSEAEMRRHFGKAGLFYYKIVRGIDERKVEPDRETKSVGAEDTFPYDLILKEEMFNELAKIVKEICSRLERKRLKGRTLTLKVKFSNFKQITRSYTFKNPVCENEVILNTGKELLDVIDLTDRKVRLLGLSVSNLSEISTDENSKVTPTQLHLF